MPSTMVPNNSPDSNLEVKIVTFVLSKWNLKKNWIWPHVIFQIRIGSDTQNHKIMLGFCFNLEKVNSIARIVQIVQNRLTWSQVSQTGIRGSEHGLLTLQRWACTSLYCANLNQDLEWKKISHLSGKKFQMLSCYSNRAMLWSRI